MYKHPHFGVQPVSIYTVPPISQNLPERPIAAFLMPFPYQASQSHVFPTAFRAKSSVYRRYASVWVSSVGEIAIFKTF